MTFTNGSSAAAPTAESQGNTRFLWPEVGFIAFGLVSALIVAALLAWCSLTFHVALYAWSFWMVVPAGAIFCGIASGSGYILAARLLHRRPGRVAIAGAIATSALGYIAIYYFQYRASKVSGVALSSVMPFSDFVDVVLRSTSILVLGHSGMSRTGALGVAGYPLAALHLAGYAFGGFGASVIASAGSACDRCRRFLSPRSATAYGRTAVGAFQYVRRLAEQGHGAAALSYVERLHEPESNIRLRLEVATCRSCERELYSAALAAFGSVAVGYVPLGQETPATEQWKPVAGYTTSGAVDIATIPAPTPPAVSV